MCKNSDVFSHFLLIISKAVTIMDYCTLDVSFIFLHMFDSKYFVLWWVFSMLQNDACRNSCRYLNFFLQFLWNSPVWNLIKNCIVWYMQTDFNRCCAEMHLCLRLTGNPNQQYYVPACYDADVCIISNFCTSDAVNFNFKMFWYSKMFCLIPAL
jgi:hypothetical protein